MTNNSTCSTKIVPVYTVTKTPTDATESSFMMENQPKKIVLNVNNIKIEIGDNVTDVNITHSGINITYK